ncbi:deaminase domain-containing protein [Bacillus bombysepticus]|uniref:CMP/dCMP-type deaminase domain-containing protein n=1 Tax=Bacillus thuringiensis serovar kumamotoensis TaxID=132267 RepID=A0A9X6PMF8_BACUK|nr:deaminase domain-containing protein [Bacillus thuringiensis]MEC2869501.1 deaminase domain-containing protein [Bacillus cereus]OTZ65583.1 hypothetical protein BK769_33280 [Bacillus thuringiensis serovar kumamtoensis]
MNKYSLLKIDRKKPSIFYQKFEEKYKELLQGILNENLEITQEYFDTLAKSPNIGYLLFIGKIDGKMERIELFAHSQIQRKENKKISSELHEFLLESYSVQVEKPNYKDGYVNYLNNNLFFGDSLDIKDVWYRDVDSESKLIENFFIQYGGKEIQGRIQLFTTYSPCLSCNGKLLRFLEEHSNVSIEVSYLRVYNGFKRRR